MGKIKSHKKLPENEYFSCMDPGFKTSEGNVHTQLTEIKEATAENLLRWAKGPIVGNSPYGSHCGPEVKDTEQNWASLSSNTCTSLSLNVIQEGASALQMNSGRRMNQTKATGEWSCKASRCALFKEVAYVVLYIVNEKIPTLFLNVWARRVNYIPFSSVESEIQNRLRCDYIDQHLTC